MAENPEQLISYDPAMVPVCGGVAAALLFCWFEALFLSPHQTPAFIAKTGAEWCAGVGMLKPQFSKAFNRIGVTYQSTPLRSDAKLAGREFYSQRFERHLFYAMEVTHLGTPSTLYRNAFEIDYALSGLDRRQHQVETTSSKLSGKLTAKDLAKRLHL